VPHVVHLSTTAVALLAAAAVIAFAVANSAQAQWSSYQQPQTFTVQPAYPYHPALQQPDINSLIPHYNTPSWGGQTIQTPGGTMTCHTFPTGGGYVSTQCN
jgi:hypothetical protein